MKDSKTIRNEHQSFVDAWKKIQEDNSSTPVKEGYKDVKKMLKTPKKGYKVEKVLVRKSGAFTALAEKYNMSPKQFGRYVEANQHLFDIPTRKKAILANKFQGFKETKEWDKFFGDLELVESKAPYVVHEADRKGNTPAWQGYVEGKINEITGQPLYVAGEDLQQEGIIDTVKNFIGLAKNKDHKVSPKTPMGKAVTGLQKRRQETNKAIDMLNQETEVDGEDLQEITTKDTKSGTKFKVRVKDKKTNSSYIRFATRDKIAQLRSDPKIASVEMTDEGQTPEERGEKKAQAAGGGSMKKAKKDYDGDGKVETGSQEYLGSRDKAIKKAMKKRSVTTEQVGVQVPPKEETKVVDKPDYSGLSKAQIMAKERIAAKKAGTYTKPKTAQELATARIGSGTAKKPETTIAQVKKSNTDSMKEKARARFDAFKAKRAERRAQRMAKEELSDWRQDLKEIMGEVEKTEGKKSKSKKMKNGVCINPDTDDEKNKYEEVNAQKVAESLGAELQSLKIEDADGNVAYEVIDLVKPDPMKENVMLTYKSGQGFDAKLGGRSVRNTISNVKTAVNVAKDIKNTGIKKTFKKYTNGSNDTTSKPSISDNISSAIKDYKSST